MGQAAANVEWEWSATHGTPVPVVNTWEKRCNKDVGLVPPDWYLNQK